MVLVVVALGGGLLDGAVHSLDLAVGPRVVGLGKPVLDIVGATDLVETVDTPAGGLAVAVLGQLSELNAVVGQQRVDPVRDHLEQFFQELSGCRPGSLVVEPGHGELRGSVNGYEEIELALTRAHPGNIHVKKPMG